MTGAVAPPQRAGRQRSKEADEAILAATLELLGQHGYDRLTMTGVIERSGVSSATLYRRWTTKHELVVAALASLAPEAAAPDTGSLAGDLEVFIRQLARSVAAKPVDVADALSIVVKRDAALATALREKFLTPRILHVKGMLARAFERGELTDMPAPEVAYSLIAGPVYHRGSVMREALTPAFIRRATIHALRGLGANADVPVGRS